MMLRMGGGGGGRGLVDSDSVSEYEVQYDEGDEEDDQSGNHNSVDENDYDEDAFDAQDTAVDIDPSAYDDDEAYARALQNAEARELAAQLMSFNGIHDCAYRNFFFHFSPGAEVLCSLRLVFGSCRGCRRCRRRRQQLTGTHQILGRTQCNLFIAIIY